MTMTCCRTPWVCSLRLFRSPTSLLEFRERNFPSTGWYQLIGAERHVRACPGQHPACPQQAELAGEHPYLRLSPSKPSFKQQSINVPPLTSEVPARNYMDGTEFSRKMVLTCSCPFCARCCLVGWLCLQSPFLLKSVPLYQITLM